MTQGGSISLHSDNVSALDEENVVQDVYSAVVYLTDDYVGGEINFPNSNIKTIPEAGSLIYFKGEVDNPHLVKPVISGKRINFILFFEDIISL
jgi:predicted 2-oxoglutarate/Fe(II)-dependent dioxygenase YbiX